MAYVSILLAALAGFAAGAVWYVALSKPWIRASGIPVTPEGKPRGGGSALPFVVSAVAMVLVAGLLRWVLDRGGITGPRDGLLTGLAVGALFIAPWIGMDYAYAGRPRLLWLIDAGYAVIGCGVIGLVLGLF